MANVTNRLPSFDVFAWWLSDPDIATLLNYPDGGFPFYPVSEQPESGFPHVRYTTAQEVHFPQWYLRTELLGLDIYMGDIMDSTELVNRLMDHSIEGAKAARDLSKWLRDNGRQIDFEFHSITWIGGGDIGAPEEEGGAHSRIANFAIQFSPLAGTRIA